MARNSSATLTLVLIHVFVVACLLISTHGSRPDSGLQVLTLTASGPFILQSGHSRRSSQRYTALPLLEGAQGSLRPVLGTPHKHSGGPLLVQDKPWEPRIDNGYPSVVHSPGEALGEWRLWYSGCTKSNLCYSQVLMHANSSDGIHWHKPNLGLIDLGVTSILKHFDNKSTAQISAMADTTANNVITCSHSHEGATPGGAMGGIGISHEPDSPVNHRFKASGGGCFGSPAPSACPKFGEHSNCVKGTAVSADGLHWSEARNVTFPDPQKYDTHNNLFFDSRIRRYVMTTRRFDQAAGRTAAVALAEPASPETRSWNHWNTSRAPPQIWKSIKNQAEVYAQITFPFHDIYLGLVMVFDSAKPFEEGRVHCRLAWSSKPDSGWSLVDDAGGLQGRDFIPLGADGSFDSHICFAAKPIEDPDRQQATRLYYFGGNGPHHAIRSSSLGLAFLRPDGYVGVGGKGNLSALVPVTGSRLACTFDITEPGGYVRIGAKDLHGLGVTDSIPLSRSATDAEVKFRNGASFAELANRGEKVQLHMEVSGAVLYTFGFIA